MAEWSQERRDKASAAMKNRNEAKKASLTSKRIRTPLGAKRELFNVETPDGYTDRIVNDVDDRIKRRKQAGYELVEDAQLGTSNVDGNQALSGVVSRDMGKGVTGYLMRQKNEYLEADRAAKQREVDESEEGMRKNVKHTESKDGTYGTTKIG